MRFLFAALMAFGGWLASNHAAVANGQAQCFDKARLAYVDCEEDIWDGAYIGGHVGYVEADLSGAYDGFSYGDLDVSGGLVGGQFGWQEQFDSGLVLGAEIDASIAWAEDGLDRVGFGFINPDIQGAIPERIDAQLNWLASIRARVGFAIDRFLPYLTGGVAWGNFETSANTQRGAFDIDETVFGAVFGGGVEYKIDDDWILGVESLFYKFEEGVSLSPPGLAGDKVVFGDVFTVRARLSFQF